MSDEENQATKCKILWGTRLFVLQFNTHIRIGDGRVTIDQTHFTDLQFVTFLKAGTIFKVSSLNYHL